jgi:hypothetical protein
LSLAQKPFTGFDLMQTETSIFDATRPVAINLRAPGGVKTVRVRFPSDAEWTERQRRRKVIVKQLGRGISETTVANGENIDAALLAKIRTEETPEVDPFEASKVIEQLSQTDVDDVIQTGDSFRITTRVLGGTTVHVLKMPSAKDVADYRRGFARVLDLPFNKQDDVPIIHEAVAVKAAIDALEAGFQEDRDTNF